MQKIQDEMSAVDTKLLILKLTTGATSLLLFIGSAMQLWHGTRYQTQSLVCLYNLIFAWIMIITEFSPLLLEDLLMEFFPFLGTITGKAVFYLILGTFCIDGHFNFLGRIGGYMCFLIAICWIAYDYVYYKNPRSKVESGFKNFYADNKNKFPANDVDHNRSHISEYSMQSMHGGNDNHQNEDYRPPNLGANEGI